MDIRLSVRNFEINNPEVFTGNTNLNVSFRVVFDGLTQNGSPPMPNEEPHHHYGFMVKIMGYQNPDSSTRIEQELFEFERTVFRWISTGNILGNGGYLGGDLRECKQTFIT